MNNHNLVIFDLDELYKIFLEIKKHINFDCEKADKHQLSNLNSKSNYLIFTKKEISGFEVINELLLRFTKAVNNSWEGHVSYYDELILKILPPEFNFSQPTLYNRLMGVCTVIASYSDSKAVLTYKKLKGLKF